MQPDFIVDGKQRLPNVDRTLKRLERIIKKKNIKVAQKATFFIVCI